jgi:redox-sensitive bicupin YhaK (pirin superfamily)
MISVRKSEFREHTRSGWLDSYQNFSFAIYHEERGTGFRALRAVNEHRLAGGCAADVLSHHEFEIITYVISGTLTHTDSLGHLAFIKPGEVQCLTAGTGIEHVEDNDSTTEPVHFLQLCLLPSHRRLQPRYAHASFPKAASRGLTLACSADGRGGSIPLNLAADLFIGRLAPRESVSYGLRHRHCGWLQVFAGEIVLNGHRLCPGDGAALQSEFRVPVSTERGAHLLLLDLG